MKNRGGGYRDSRFSYPLLTTHSLSPLATMNAMSLRTLCIALLTLLPAAALFPAAAGAQTADEILAKVLAARGGLDKMRAINSERVSGIISFGDATRAVAGAL